MTVNVGKAAIVRFPKDPGGGNLSVCMVYAYRGELALVAKSRGRGGYRKWCRSRWVPAADIAREATAREVTVGMPIDPVPPRPSGDNVPASGACGDAFDPGDGIVECTEPKGHAGKHTDGGDVWS